MIERRTDTEHPLLATPRAIGALTAAINAIAAKVDLPLDLTADLLQAVDACATEHAAEAVAGERERIAKRAGQCDAFYYTGATPTDADNGLRSFADLLRGEQPAVPETQPLSDQTEA